MREIKFRAWDVENKIYYSRIWNVCFLIGGIRFAWDDYENSDGETMITDLVNGSYELMQYTGLKDRNGKEIYFGDILQTFNNDSETDIWEAEDYGYTVCEEDPDELCVRFTNWYPTTEEDSVFNWKYVEVIGNIYQDSHLLL
jgi:uncharacterized phage protein (TIGR01671 family)